MPPSAPPALADRFARLIEGLCRALAARGTGLGLAGPLLALLWSRLRRTTVRFARLAEKVRAGTLPPPRRRLRSPRPVQPPPPRLPRGFAWLVRRLPQAAAAASQLQYLLADPAMADLLAAAPQAGRLLRPLCRMLGVRPPPLLRPPPPVRPPPSGRRPRPAPPSGPGRRRPRGPASARRPPSCRPPPAPRPFGRDRAAPPHGLTVPDTEHARPTPPWQISPARS